MQSSDFSHQEQDADHQVLCLFVSVAATVHCFFETVSIIQIEGKLLPVLLRDDVIISFVKLAEAVIDPVTSGRQKESPDPPGKM